MEAIWPGEGPLICIYTGPSGKRCTKHEIDGLEYCFWHVPEDLLEEAEAACGRTRCRKNFGTVAACHFVATEGTSPPRCKNHGANAGSVISKRASGQVVEGRVQDRMVAIMAEHGDRLLNPPPVGNPLVELLGLAAEMAAWKNVMRDVVVYLTSRERITYAHDRVGEQLRAEVLIYERSMERLATILERITKLGIEARLAAIEEAQVALVDRALTAALTASGLDLVAQAEARTVLRRELTKAAKSA